MRLFLRRDNSMVHSRYVVADSSGFDKFVVTGKYADAFQKMALSSLDGQVLVKIRLLLSNVLATFIVRSVDERFTITASIKGNSVDFRFHGINWTICCGSDFRSFDIFDTDGSLVMSRNAETYACKGYYTLDIFSENKELFCIAVAICIDALNFADSVVTATV